MSLISLAFIRSCIGPSPKIESIRFSRKRAMASSRRSSGGSRSGCRLQHPRNQHFDAFYLFRGSLVGIPPGISSATRFTSFARRAISFARRWEGAMAPGFP